MESTNANPSPQFDDLMGQAELPVEPMPRRRGRPRKIQVSTVRVNHGGGLCNSRQLLDTVRRSAIYQDYERAFTDATGLPLTLRPVESWQLPHHGRRNENAFCSLIANKSRACAACLQVHQQLAELASARPQSIVCMAGLCDTAVPVRIGERLMGFLQTGQIFRKPPTNAQYDKVARLLTEWGVEANPEEIRNAWFSTQVVAPHSYEAMIRLLNIFAQHLALVSNQILVHQQNAEPPMIARAKEYIQQHQTEAVSLANVAKAVNASPYYFCKMFKRVTGLNFTNYVTRVRTEKAKNLLLNPNLRVSEIAFEVGFQSLTHFNRVFKRILGQSPSEYRAQFTSL